MNQFSLLKIRVIITPLRVEAGKVVGGVQVFRNVVNNWGAVSWEKVGVKSNQRTVFAWVKAFSSYDLKAGFCIVIV
jgi:hypothetical protein